MKPSYHIQTIDNERVVLEIAGDLTIQHIEEFKERLDSLFSLKDSIQISLSNVKSIDVSALQLLYLFTVKTYDSAKRLTITPASDLENFELVQKAGLLHIIEKTY